MLHYCKHSIHINITFMSQGRRAHMQIDRLVIQLLKPLQAKFADRRTQGYSAGKYARARLECELVMVKPVIKKGG